MSIIITAVLVFATIFFSSVALYLRFFLKSHLYQTALQYDGPPGLPIIGNAHSFIGDTTRIINTLMKWLDVYPSPVRVWLGNRLFFGVYEPEQMKAILVSSEAIDKADLYNFFDPWVGKGLLTATGKIWRLHRKLIAPTFNNKILESSIEIFEKQAEIMTVQMRKESGRGEFEVLKYVGLCALDIISETAMGVELQIQVGRDDRYVRSVSRSMKIIWQRCFKLWLHFDFLFNLTKLARIQNESLKIFHSTINKVIRQKKIEMERKVSENEHISEKFPVKKIFLDRLMELSSEGEKFTEQELRDEVNTMMIAGYDTTAIMDTFVMFILANYPNIQKKVFEELCEIFGDQVTCPANRPIQNEDLKRMNYLERVIKETLRIFPVLPVFLRVLHDDIDIGGRQVLPKGSHVMIAPIKVHRWEKIWPDPLKFDPDRFLPEEVAKRHPYSYIPFSAGPRNCIGMAYAMMSMKTVLATVVRRYVLIKDEPVDIASIQIKPEITLKCVDPLKIRIENR